MKTKEEILKSYLDEINVLASRKVMKQIKGAMEEYKEQELKKNLSLNLPVIRERLGLCGWLVFIFLF